MGLEEDDKHWELEDYDKYWENLEKFNEINELIEIGDRKVIDLIKKASVEVISMEARKDEYTLLHTAISMSKICGDEICKLLIERMTIEGINAHGCGTGTALHECAEVNNIKLCKLLIPMMLSKINYQDTMFEETALHYAVRKGHKEISNLLISNMSLDGINAKNTDNQTALDIVTEKLAVYTEIAEMLKNLGVK
jgi:hydrogenase maturation factor